MTKKLKVSLIGVLSLLMCFALAFGLWFGAVPAKAAEGDTEESTREERTPAVTYVLGAESGDVEGAEYYINRVIGWNTAIEKAVELGSSDADNALVKVILADDWRAAGDALYTTTFGDGTGFNYGRLLVAENADVVFDLNGHILDRNLTTGVGNGHVFRVVGSLEIIDSNPTADHGDEYTYQSGYDDETKEAVYTSVKGGVITGGFNLFSSSANGGGISNAGNLVMSGGTIYGNYARTGSAVFNSADSVFTMNGGAICGNKINYSSNNLGGTVYVAENAVFTMNDGTIAGNYPTAASGTVNGCGVLVGANGEFVMNGGKIAYNRANNGGGVYVSSGGTATINDGEISGNAGGGVYAGGTTTLNGGYIRGNTASSGAGVSVNNSGTVFTMNGGEISGNVSSSYGAGIIGGGGTTVINGGKIIGNTSNSTNTNFGGGGIFMNGNLYLNGGEISGNAATVGSGGGIRVNNGYLYVSGSPVVKDNTKGGNANDIYIAKAVTVTGKLNQDAELYFAYTGATLTDYAKYNSVDGYAVNPTKYIYYDVTTYHPVLNESGTVLFRNYEVKWTVNGEEVEDYGLAYAYGNKTIESITVNNKAVTIGEAVSDVKYDEEGNVASYEFSASVGSGNAVTAVKFEIRINPKSIVGSEVTLEYETTSFTGEALEPAATVVFDENALGDGDYAVTYANNRNTGEAQAIVTGKGNYTGSVTKTFVITKNNANYSEIVWQYFDGNNWSAIDAQTTFIFDGTNQNNKIRAELPLSASAKDYVYAQGCAPEDTENWNNGMWLTFTGASEVNAFVNAGSYEVSLVHNDKGNAVFAEGYVFIVSLTMKPTTLDITDEDFAGVDGMWLVSYKDEKLPLIDGADVNYLVNGEVFKGDEEKTDSYARYRGDELELVLNGECNVGGVTLNVYLQSSTVAYTDNKATGEVNAITTVTSTAVLTLKDNYLTAAGEDTITITKTWYIVSINNGFTTTDGEPLPTITGWTYGGERSVVEMKPEHGNVIIYNISLNISRTGVARRKISILPATEFAALYSEDGVAYYAVSNGSIDIETPIVDESGKVIDDYLNYVMERLGAGSYVLRVSLPEHRDEDGVVYYPTATEFSFTVSAYEIANEDGLPNEGILHHLKSLKVPYNGQNNNTPEIILTLNGRTLVEGVDYELLSDSVNVGGWADLTVRGLDGLIGEYTIIEAFQIVQTNNDWLSVPSLVSWVYGSYNEEINYIIAEPRYLDSESGLWFRITTDAEGENPVNGLSMFRFTDGNISTLISNQIAKLNAGEYYLFATVETTDNYVGLSPNGVPFSVKQLTNAWIANPVINSWTWGEYSEPVVAGVSTAGTVLFTVNDSTGAAMASFNISDGKLPTNVSNVLKNLPAGDYTLNAHVDGDVNGNYNELDGSVPFTVAKVVNDWKESVSVINWSYGNYNPETNRIFGSPLYGEVTYSIKKDGKAVDGLGEFTEVTQDEAKILAGLHAGDYTITATITVDGNHFGLDARTVPFTIAPAPNDWLVSPNIIEWHYGEFNTDLNLVLAKVSYGKIFVKFTDKDGKALTDEFELDENGKVPQAKAEVLKGLNKGEYKLVVRVQVDDSNYSDIRDLEPVPFNVNKAENKWEQTLGITTWIEGRFNAEENLIEVKAKFGNVTIRIVDSTDTEKEPYYEGALGTEELNEVLAGLKVGTYQLTAKVVGNDDYSDLVSESILFNVFEKPGLPWWAILLIVVGSLGVAALILWILHEKGILQMLTGRIVIAMRTRMTVDATIAAVRANKRAEEAKKSIAKAEALDRLEAAKKAREEQRNMSPEERAAALEEKAAVHTAKAEKNQKRAERLQKQASRLKKTTEDESTIADARTEEATEDEAPETQPAETAENEAPETQPAETAENEAPETQPVETAENEAPAEAPTNDADEE